MTHITASPNPIANKLDVWLAQHIGTTRKWVVVVTGSGGKTTTIEHLAGHWKQQGHSVLISTTTRMALPKDHIYPVDRVVVIQSGLEHVVKSSGNEIVLYGVQQGEKLGYAGEPWLQKSADTFDRVILEADGARSLPLKIHTDRDPVIPSYGHAVIAVMGLSALDKRLDDSVMFECARYRSMTGDSAAHVTNTVYRELLKHPEGVLKGCGNLPTLVCCNQSDAIAPSRIPQFMHDLCDDWSHRACTVLCCSWLAGTLEWESTSDGLNRARGVEYESF